MLRVLVGFLSCSRRTVSSRSISSCTISSHSISSSKTSHPFNRASTVHLNFFNMPSTPKYVALEEASDRTSADIQSEYAEEKTELRRKHQAQKLLTYLSWYSAISTAIILMLSIAVFTKSLQPSKMVRSQS